MTLPNRQSIRMKGWNYARPGWYFVTFNTQGGKALFGTIVAGRMVLNEAGRVASEEWRKSAAIRRSIELDEFVVMPDHVHGIVRIVPDAASAGGNAGGDRGDLPVARTARLFPRSLGAFIAGYKGAAGKRINEMRRTPGAAVWHRNYWDVIVRDERALANIRNYVRCNPQNFDAAMNAGEPRFLGNKALLDMPKMGFLASRGEAAPHGRLPVKSGEAVLSGFLSPMERAVFKAGLEQKKPLIWVKPWGLQESRHAAPVCRAVAEGRLLLVSPFDDKIEAPSARRAVWCNQYVLAHCDRLVVGHLNPDGMLACILSEADPEMEIMYL